MSTNRSPLLSLRSGLRLACLLPCLLLLACALPKNRTDGANGAGSAETSTVAARTACPPGANCTASGAVVTTNATAVRDGRPIEKAADSGAVFQKVPADSAGFYFMRAAGPANVEPYNLFVDRRYVASLRPGTWSYVELCPGEHLLQVVSEASALMDNTRAPLRVKVDGGSSYFVDVRSPDPQGFVRLDATQAAQMLRTPGRTAVPTLPRLPGRSCAQTPPVVATIGDNLLRYQISSDTLFDANRSDIHKNNVRQATAVMLSIVLDIKQRDVLIEAMDIQGHTDPQGSAVYNQALSLRRAQTVAKFFQNAGAPAKRVRPVGMGGHELVIRNCDRMVSRPQREACDYPNRRVEIVVYTRPASNANEAARAEFALDPSKGVTASPKFAPAPRLSTHSSSKLPSKP